MPFDKEGVWHGNPNRLAIKETNKHLYHDHDGIRTDGGTLAERLKLHRQLHEHVCGHLHEPVGEEEDLTQYAERLRCFMTATSQE